MATFSVRTDTDGGPGSLRDAVQRANDNFGPDTILFDNGITFLRLTQGEIEITDALTIDGGASGVTITGDAEGDDVVVNGVTDVAASLGDEDLLDDNSRIFNVTDRDAATRLVGLTLTGGRTTADEARGGAVSSLADFTVERSLVAGNSTAGTFSSGGGLEVDADLTVTNSTISGNSTAGRGAIGGGLALNGALTMTDSIINGNSTKGEDADGGGVWSTRTVVVSNSTISGNSTAGDEAEGGGLYARGDATVTNSTISGNSTATADGGGLYANSFLGGSVTLTDSIVLGNRAGGAGDEIGGAPNASSRAPTSSARTRRPSTRAG